jgi:hypothetical protein
MFKGLLESNVRRDKYDEDWRKERGLGIIYGHLP